MAMTAQVKAELAGTQVTKTCCRKSEVSSLLRFAGGLHIVSGRIVVEAELDTGAAARRLRKDIAEIYGHSSDVVMVSGNGLRKGSRYVGAVAVDLGDVLAEAARGGAGVELGLHHDATAHDVQPAREPEHGRHLGLATTGLRYVRAGQFSLHLCRHRHASDPATC